MKKITYLSKFFAIIGLMTLLTISCNKDESPSITEAFLVGTWSVTDFNIDATVDGKSMIAYYAETFGVSESIAEIMLEGLMEEMFAGFEGTYSFSSDFTYIFSYEEDDSEDQGTWQLDSDGKVILLDEGTEFETTLKVKSKSDNTLVVLNTQTRQEDINEDGYKEEIKSIIEISLTKQP